MQKPRPFFAGNKNPDDIACAGSLFAASLNPTFSFVIPNSGSAKEIWNTSLSSKPAFRNQACISNASQLP